MTTFFSIAPSSIAPPQFSPTLDGNQYLCKLLWNVSAQRYYINCYGLDGTLIFSVPVVSSMPGNLILSLVWNALDRKVYGTCENRIGVPVGSIILRTIENAVPIGFNGFFQMLVTSNNTFTYSLNTIPQPVTSASGLYTAVQPGALSQLVSMSSTYFNSTLVLRNGQFEVSP